MTAEHFHPLLAVEDVPDTGYAIASIPGYTILLARLDDEYFAVENLCTHASSKLEGGRLKLGRISCPLHGAKFDFRTGASMGGSLTQKGLRTFATRVIDGWVSVDPHPLEGATVPFHALSTQPTKGSA